MEDNSVDIEFDYRREHCRGWATPSAHTKQDGSPASYHVVLNGVMFGNVSINNSQWSVDEQRRDELTGLVGKSIEQYMHK